MEAPESILRLSSTDGSPATLSRLQFQTVNAPGIFTPLGAIEFFDQAGARLALIQGTKASTTAQVAINVTPGQVSQLTVKPGVIDAAADLRFLRPTDLATSASIGTAGADSFFQAHGGGLGIGTTAPAARLHAIGESGAATAVLGETGSTIGRGVAGHATAATGSNFGVVGQSDSASGTGVLGYTLATTGENSSVWGWNNSTAGRGVYGLAANAFGESYGVYGRSAGSAGVGVFGEAAAGTGFTAGVHGKSASFSGAGVRAEGAGPLGTALDIRSGSIRVAGAGPGTSTPAFIHVATQANSNNCDGSGCFCYATRIDHPLCNGDPSAILLVTVNGRAGSGSTLLQRVEYDVGEARWYIHVFFDEYFCAGQKFNVLVIKS